MVIFLQLSQLYIPLGYILGMPSSQLMSLIMTGVGAFTIVVNFDAALKIMRFPISWLWMIVIWVLPVMIMTTQLIMNAIQFVDFLYWFGIISSTGIIFLLGLIYAYTSNEKKMTWLIILSLAGISLGFLVNFIDYGIIRNILIYSSSKLSGSFYTGRKMGFFPHPNMAAFSIFLCISILSLAFVRQHKGPLIPILFVVMLVFILTTGSRTSLFLYVILNVALAILSLLRERSAAVLQNRMLVLAGGGAIVLPIIILFAAPLTPKDSAIAVGLERAGTAISIATSSSSVEDSSASMRVALLAHYFEYSLAHPLLGTGPQSGVELVKSRVFMDVSQNSWVQWAVYYGWPYSIFTLVALLYTPLHYFNVARHKAYMMPYATNMALFMSFVLLSTASLVDIFFVKAMTLTLAMFLGHLSRLSVSGGSHRGGFPPRSLASANPRLYLRATRLPPRPAGPESRSRR